MRKLKKQTNGLAAKSIHAFGIFLMVIQTFAVPISYGAMLTFPIATAADETAAESESLESSDSDTKSDADDNEEKKSSKDETPSDDSPSPDSNSDQAKSDDSAAATDENPAPTSETPVDIAAPETNGNTDALSADENNDSNKKTCLDDNAEIKTGSSDDWKVDGDTAETKDKVMLGVKYEFPLNKNVSVTFTCLPGDESKLSVLKIEQIRSSEINLPNGVSAAYEYAYDITTGMKNGDFKYDLTLPKTENINAQISYIEKSASEAIENNLLKSDLKEIENDKVKKDDDLVKIEKLDHFTIFLVVWNFPNNPDNAIADGGTPANLAKTITVVGASNLSFNTSGATTSSASANNWDNGSGIKYWQVELSSKGFNNLKLYSKQKSSDTGPKNFKVQYSLGGSSWTDVSGGNVTVLNDSFASGTVSNLTLPSEMDNKDSVYLRWIMTSDISAGGGSVGSSGTNRIDDIVIRGALTFTTPECLNDSDGANDEPEQKDLTRLCREQAFNNPLNIKWNWDIISRTGNNSADACALFDTDSIGSTGYGYADYSLCVTWKLDAQQITGSPVLYRCNNTRTDRCAGASAVSINYGSSCGVDVLSEDPFSSGDSYPYDAVAGCTIDLADVGGVSKANLLDICSYPSAQPNSDPSDCVVISAKKGNLEVVKNVSPDDPNTNWNITVTGPSSFNDALTGDDTTGIRAIDSGSGYSITETAGANTNSGDYTTAYSCIKNGSAYLSGSGTTISEISIDKSDLVICVFTNTLKTGTIVVHKDVQDPNGNPVNDTSKNFTIKLDNSDARTITDNGTVTYNNVRAGTHTISEDTPPAGYSLFSITPDIDPNAPGAQISVAAGQTTNVYVVNRQQNATITVIKDVLNPDGGEVSDDHEFTVNVGDQSGKVGEGKNEVFTVAPGIYTVSENSDPDYELVSITPDEDYQADGAQVIVGPGEQQTVNVTNKQKKARIEVSKDVVAPDGTTDVSDNHPFTIQLNEGNNESISENNPATFDVNPGLFTVSELDDQDYDEMGCKLPTGADAANFTIKSNEQFSVTCKNKQKNATINVVKDVVKSDGETQVSDDYPFLVTLNNEKKNFAEGNPAVFLVAPGTYEAVEKVEDKYTLVSNDGPKTVGSNGQATITIVNKQNPGSISGYKFGADGQTGLSGWTINLFSCPAPNFAGCKSSTSTQTDENGYYSFNNLITGFYKVKEVLQSGWTNLSSLFHNVTIEPGADSKDNNFTNFENVSVMACKVIDADGNIETLEDQAPRSGWTVNLLTDGEITDTQETTEQDGCYTWEDLGPNHSYGVSEDVPTKWSARTDATHDFGEAASGSNYAYTFINTQLGEIIVEKQTSPESEQSFEFNPSYGNNFFLTDGGTNNSGYLLPGKYSVSEVNMSDDWDLTNTNCISSLGNTESAETLNLDPGNLNLNPGETITCTFTNTQRGSIVIEKNTTGGDDTFEFSATGKNLPASFNLKTSDGMGSQTFSNVPAGSEYAVSETELVGWKLASASCDKGDIDAIEVLPGETTTCVFTNTKSGRIIVDKVTDPSENGQFFDFTVTGNGYNNFSLKDGDDPNNQELQPGTYTIFEEPVDGWDLTGIDCVSQKPDSPTERTNLCHRTKSDIHPWNAISVPVNNHVHNNHIDDFLYTGPTDKNGHPISKIGEQWCADNVPENDITNRSFISVIEEEENAVQPKTIDLSAGEIITCTFTNTFITPELLIEKSNDSVGPQAPGTTVNYTIKVKALKNKVKNVLVTDLPPNGFEFVTGSADQGFLQTPYASPGVWNLGDIAAGQTVSITYTARIGGLQSPGDYNDMAWARGSSDIGADDILANDEDPFVGTKVAVVVDAENPINVALETDTKTKTKTKTVIKQVLGAATGTETSWSILAFVLLATGLLFVYFGKNTKTKKGSYLAKIMVFFAITAGLIFAANKTLAATSALSVKIGIPESPTKNTDFKIGFVALDIDGRLVTAQCYKEGVPDAAVGTEFAPKNGGNSGNCVIDSSVMPTDGVYKFFVKIQSGIDEINSDLAIVELKTGLPGTPLNYDRDNINNCEKKISFRTANDGVTAVVELYRSTETDFTADNSTRVADLAIGPGQDGNFTDIVPDCNEDYFYAIRAFDALGNGSEVVGDIKEKTRTRTRTKTVINTVPGAIIPAATTGGETAAGGETTGEVSGETANEQQKEAEKAETEILGEETAAAEKSFFRKTLSWIIFLVVLGTLFYAYYRTKKRTSGVA